jgi:amidase
MSVPLGQSGVDLPIGVQFAAGWAHDGRLLRLAAQLEVAAPWRERVPEVWAGR